jgi:hypothetical protein
MNITTSSEEDDESRRQFLCFEDLHYHLRHHGGSVRPTSMAQATSPPIDLPDLARRAVFLHHNDEDLRCITEDTMSSSQVTALLFSRPAINGLPIRRPVGLVEREPNWKDLRGLLANCTERHQQICTQPVQSSLERIWLIDVRCRSLVSYRESCSKRYAALSYMWGGVSQPRIRKAQRLPKVLPLTVEDAMTAAKNLNIEYVWVDSMCIDQGNEEEKLSQISIMDQIYEGAVITFVALDGLDANSGLPGVGRRSPRHPQQLTARFGTVELLSRCPRLQDQLIASPWSRRACK